MTPRDAGGLGRKETPLVRKSIGSALVLGGGGHQIRITLNTAGGRKHTAGSRYTHTHTHMCVASGPRRLPSWTGLVPLGRSGRLNPHVRVTTSRSFSHMFFFFSPRFLNKEVLFFTCTVGAANVTALGMCQCEAVCCLRVGGFA